MHARSLRYIGLICSAFLLVVAVIAWPMYMGFGIAYGSVYGLPGREEDLAYFGSRASIALATAASSEAIAVGVGTWLLMPFEEKWLRLLVATALAVVADAATFALIRGL